MTNGRRLHLGLNAPPLGSSPYGWRRAGIDPLSSATGEFYARIAVEAERGLFDALFLNDQPTLHPGWETSPAPLRLDPIVALATAAQHTRWIGLVPTISTTWNHPYNLARSIASLDRASHGRAGWNVVTSYNPKIAANFGLSRLPSKQDRYARAAEFIDVVADLWRTWAPDAIIADKQTGVFTRPGGVRLVEHHGAYFTVHGGATVPPSEQGLPVLFQAGGSPEGIALAARYADAAFVSTPTLESALEYRARAAAAATARATDRPRLLVLSGAALTLASTDEEALRHRIELEGSDTDAVGVGHIAARLGIPIAALDLDSPIPLDLVDVEARRRDDSEGFVNSIVHVARTGRPLREILRTGVGHLAVIGSPEKVADIFEEWFRADAVDGFNLHFDVVEEGLPAFVDEVVPLLRKRGIYRHAYDGGTLRSHLGLPTPQW
ncbi:NtaA/DmoA family FMN-dependent monooxygenase [Dactylosporangium sp. NPDC051484]|uniref:NtaA/DmoA family FMN-dependent monooxygenase n=1 Tax=Dactylosporangium sp. NPDC051484 TaxID=3154942 RepID=UPI0034502766